jgi:hypothetical protein
LDLSSEVDFFACGKMTRLGTVLQVKVAKHNRERGAEE